MHPIFQRTPSITPAAGKIYDGDTLNRKPDCEYLRDGILAAKSPCVLAVNASWGAGKTTFLQMLREECEVAGMPCVYFDAWKNDFHSDALAPMIGEINKQLAPKGKFKKSILAVGSVLKNPESYTHAIDFVMNIFKKADLTAATAEAVGVEMPKADDLCKFLQKMNAKSNAIVEYAEREKAMDNFRKELENFAIEKKGKPLVFFVDELDRCRPVFAIEVLEKIKHVFDVSGVFFVIAVNKNELQKTIKSVYGDINSTLYLRRFFDFEFFLENRGAIVIAALKRCEAKIENISDGEDLHEYLSLLCRDFGLQPRDQEQAATLVAHALALASDSHGFYPIYVAFFVVLKFANPSLYQQCLDSACGNLENFPFVDIVDYYEAMTGAQKILQEQNKIIPHRLPMLSLCAMRCFHDKAYFNEIEKSADKARIKRGQTGYFPGEGGSFWEDVISLSRREWRDLDALRDPREIFEKIELGAKKWR